MPQSPHQVLRGRIAQLLEKHPENAARLIRSLWVEDRQTEEAERDAGSSECPARVAVVMIAMGQEATAGVMKYLSDLEIERIAQAISALDVVTTEHEDEVLEEFEQLLMAGKYLSQGGIDFARGALEKALGPRKAEQLLARVTGTATEGFSLLRNIDAKHLVPFLAKEHPQTIALILSQLGPEQAATVLAELPKALQADVSFRIASMENIPPQVLRELEEGLADELHALLAGQIAEVGGPRALAEILNQADRATEEAVLTRLDAQSCELAEAVRSEMVRFDDIADLPDREIQMLLREVETKDLAVALKGASEELKSRILSNMSERVGGMIVEEMEQVGPLPKPEVERMQTGILRKLRELEEQGQITVVRGERI
ncbi:MAG: flagellar motor switch protein FliG [Candidatus Latescibacteria bacterium]|nr:flagellar motor switch protein FliG [Candidatus Latescibacterota bacterium]